MTFPKGLDVSSRDRLLLKASTIVNDNPEERQFDAELSTNERAPDIHEPSEKAAHWHANAGRKGALRIHQLIQEGRLYEQEHGLKSGRQRLRQLIELGKRYEDEHGVRPKRRPSRLSRQA